MPARNESVAEYVPFAASEPIRLSVAMILEFLTSPTKNGHKCTDKDAMKFLMLCRSRALNPWEGDAYLVGYETDGKVQFNLITAHQAFLKRAEMHPQFDGMVSGVVVQQANGEFIEREGDILYPNETLYGGWAIVHRKDRAVPTRRILNLSVFNSGYSRWKKDPGGMIVKVAEADALRSSFPTQMAGMYTQEELEPKDIQHTSEPMRPIAGRVNLRTPNLPATRPNGYPVTQTTIDRSDSQEPEKPPETGLISEPQADSLGFLLRDSNTEWAEFERKFGVSMLRKLPVAKFNEAYDWLEERRRVRVDEQPREAGSEG